ncbi:2-oxo acid dehydrogenase subunit E2 [Paraburkholderia sp. J63]|uniref:2-oxo acid dehydrogenase subunit E2 n=1 Tax=Paraburkholderia sp. J63 TaxID=2805434 RepID=UPI002ABE54AC|nr:2-oxo acid dehydrogenase subunit E2 [Paraburkholderia sp. J63]
MQSIRVPDIGDYRDIPVIEVLVRAGDTVNIDDVLVTLESDKATMDVPSSHAGTIGEVLLKPGDVVSAGSEIARLAAVAKEITKDAAAATATAEARPLAVGGGVAQVAAQSDVHPVPPPAPVRGAGHANVAAGPSVRKLARELGVDLADVKPGGPRGRVVREDVLAHAKAALAAPRPAAAAESGGSGLQLLPWPQVDFARFGPVTREPQTRIRRLSGANLHRNWVTIPHVTNFDQVDVTELDALRTTLNREAGPDAAKITLLSFVLKICAVALRRFPQFNVSLEGGEVVRKGYWHIGFAADTPAGLVVPVVRDVERKGVREIATEMASLAAAARAGKLAAQQMQGGCFSVSSLGGIGGTHFTPIINAPEVAILGVGRATMQPVWSGSAFEPRLIAPLSLSWDHRAVDGAEAARFLSCIAALMSDFRRVAL